MTAFFSRLSLPAHDRRHPRGRAGTQADSRIANHGDQCDPHRHQVGSAAHPWIDPYGIYHNADNFPYTVGYLGVAYTNDAPKTATEVDFGLVSRGSLIAITKDAGRFATGAKIDHEFSVDPEIFPIGTAFPYCAVLRVKYADASEWSNPTPPSQ